MKLTRFRFRHGRRCLRSSVQYHAAVRAARVMPVRHNNHLLGHLSIRGLDVRVSIAMVWGRSRRVNVRPCNREPSTELQYWQQPPPLSQANVIRTVALNTTTAHISTGESRSLIYRWPGSTINLTSSPACNRRPIKPAAASHY